MKTSIFVIALALLAGCAGQDEQEKPSSQDIAQAVKDFIEVRELEQLDGLKTGMSDSWSPVGDTFVIYKGRRDEASRDLAIGELDAFVEQLFAEPCASD